MEKLAFILPVLVVLLCSCESKSTLFYDEVDQPACFYNEETMTYELPGIPWKQSLKKTATALQVEWLTQDDFDYADEVEYWQFYDMQNPIYIFNLPYGVGFNIYHGKCYAVCFRGSLSECMSYEESCAYVSEMYNKFCTEYGTAHLTTTLGKTSNDIDDISIWNEVNATWEVKNPNGVASQLYFHTHTLEDDEAGEAKIYLRIGLIYDKEYLDSEWGFTDYSIDDYMN